MLRNIEILERENPEMSLFLKMLENPELAVFKERLGISNLKAALNKAWFAQYQQNFQSLISAIHLKSIIIIREIEETEAFIKSRSDDSLRTKFEDCLSAFYSFTKDMIEGEESQMFFSENERMLNMNEEIDLVKKKLQSRRRKVWESLNIENVRKCIPNRNVLSDEKHASVDDKLIGGSQIRRALRIFPMLVLSQELSEADFKVCCENTRGFVYGSIDTPGWDKFIYEYTTRCLCQNTARIFHAYSAFFEIVYENAIDQVGVNLKLLSQDSSNDISKYGLFPSSMPHLNEAMINLVSSCLKRCLQSKLEDIESHTDVFLKIRTEYLRLDTLEIHSAIGQSFPKVPLPRQENGMERNIPEGRRQQIDNFIRYVSGNGLQEAIIKVFFYRCYDFLYAQFSDYPAENSLELYFNVSKSYYLALCTEILIDLERCYVSLLKKWFQNDTHDVLHLSRKDISSKILRDHLKVDIEKWQRDLSTKKNLLKDLEEAARKLPDLRQKMEQEINF